MMCKCGFGMCWFCMKGVNKHRRCAPDFQWIYKHTRVLVVRHNSAVTTQVVRSPEELKEGPPQIQKNKQKASLYQRALYERTEKMSPAFKYSDVKVLGGNIIKAAHKDPQFKMEILHAFSNEVLPGEGFWQTTIVSRKVRQLLASSLKMKQELHHVTEFTYILLQGMPNSVNKQRILKLANDLSGICSIVRSILEVQDNQSVRSAFRRLVRLRQLAGRALDALIGATHTVRAAQ